MVFFCCVSDVCDGACVRDNATSTVKTYLTELAHLKLCWPRPLCCAACWVPVVTCAIICYEFNPTFSWQFPLCTTCGKFMIITLLVISQTFFPFYTLGANRRIASTISNSGGIGIANIIAGGRGC